MQLTRISKNAASRLELKGRLNWPHRVKLRKVPEEGGGLPDMSMASLEILEPQTRLSMGCQRPEPYSGWKVPAAVENKRQEQLAKWHIRMNSAE
jgi:hypothetical protein